MRSVRIAIFVVSALIVASSSWAGDFATGQEAYNIGDYETALSAWLPLAEEGDADCQYGVGLLYANGFGVPMDDAKALKWYQLAADQGHGRAQCNLAVMHANGWGVPQSDEEAMKWYGKAAEQGVLEAQNSLSELYATGFAVPQDYVKAYMWLTIAASLGDQGATFKMEDVTRHMSPDQVAEAEVLAANWMEDHPGLEACE